MDREMDDAVNEVLAIKVQSDTEEKVHFTETETSKGMRIEVLDVEDGGGVDVEDEDEDEREVEIEKDADGQRLERKYKSLVRRKNSSLGLNQRALLTMTSVNNLTSMIDVMENVSEE